MKFLNIGCGGVRPQGEEWTNLDDLWDQLAPGTPERINLDRETNYVNHVLGSGPLPFRPNTFDAILASHVFEHFEAQLGVYVMRLCLEVLKPGGCLYVSVPNATYFRLVYPADKPEEAVRIFGEPIHMPDGEQTFFGYALWMRQHKVLFTEDVLWCYFKRAGFDQPLTLDDEIIAAISPLLNRRLFSLEMAGVKPNQ